VHQIQITCTCAGYVSCFCIKPAIISGNVFFVTLKDIHMYTKTLRLIHRTNTELQFLELINKSTTNRKKLFKHYGHKAQCLTEPALSRGQAQFILRITPHTVCCVCTIRPDLNKGHSFTVTKTKTLREPMSTRNKTRPKETEIKPNRFYCD